MTLASSGGDNDVAVNLDIAICGTDQAGAQNCLWISEGGNETNEGFDVRIPVGYQELAVLLVKPGTWAACEDGDGRTTQNEEHRWNFMYWTR